VSDPFARMRGGLVVSVQSPPESPLAGPTVMAAIATAAVAGGAVAIRAEGPADVKAIGTAVDVPIIGLRKRDLPIRITPTLDDAHEIAVAGAHVVAVDATLRPRPDGSTTAAFIAEIVRDMEMPVLADVDTLEAGIAAAAAGATAVATTLSGYTEASGSSDRPDLALVRALVERVDVPVFAEGRYGTPADVRAALDAGAYAVVVGTAISDPFTLTRRFAAAAESHASDR
jgi:N-acylglucosamine-6-phosphate 2-epimerase